MDLKSLFDICEDIRKTTAEQSVILERHSQYHEQHSKFHEANTKRCDLLQETLNRESQRVEEALTPWRYIKTTVKIATGIGVLAGLVITISNLFKP
ncbi:MAG: hypothetical protein ACOH5I_21845 [Oligoflexus sp.]